MNTLKQSIKRHEGFRLYPYMDTTGNLTIGWGRNLTSKGINSDEAELMLLNDIITAKEDYVRLPISVRSNCNFKRKDVLVEMVFQLGFVGVLKFKKMFAALERRDFTRAADEMKDSLWYRQTPSRATELADRMKKG